MFLGIISRGIQTRVLDDKSVYGTLVVAQSVMTYFQLFSGLRLYPLRHGEDLQAPQRPGLPE